MTILIDKVVNVALHNGVVRIDCAMVAADGEEQPSATLVIPANQAGVVLNSLTAGLKELDKQLRERLAAANTAGGAAGDLPPAGNA